LLSLRSTRDDGHDNTEGINRFELHRSFWQDAPRPFADANGPVPSGGYTWRPGLWLAADMTFFTGGQTSVNGVQDNDMQRNVRYGVTLSFPLSAQWSGKLAWSRGLTTSIGGNFQTISVALQYRWFNH